ncbi:MAG: DUF262 domain-containing protein [Krumholzibacteria bacterium]|nr:DUF262 domain-containing protein [Candidatus Krumholzibacteria bacterium]
METSLSQYTIAEYCAGMKRNEIVVNRDYQRSAKVWPAIARSYLIETIMLGLPIPKLYLFQKVDPSNRQSFKEIVDGQQRSIAIREYYDDKYRISSRIETENIAGKKFSELDEVDKQSFMTYRLGADTFINATDDEVRDIFRRMNSYTIPLNAAEQRHAVFQGPFKWFVHALSKEFDPVFLQMGLFTRNRIVRMADATLITEICDAFAKGIRTTKKPQLDALYKSRDRTFREEEEWRDRISEAINQLAEWTSIHGGKLMRAHIVYSLLLAITHSSDPVLALEPIVPSPRLAAFDDDQVIENLSSLAEALEDPENAGDFGDFVEACAKKTNTEEQRVQRFKWMCKALSQDL